jgi:hypothetical protein
MRVRLTELVGEELVTLKRAGGWDVRRAEIIAAMCQAAREAEAVLSGESEEAAAYARHIATKLERILGQIEPEMDIPTCTDFPHLGLECCPVCHNEYPDEMEIIEIESGGKAWICCSVDRALSPTRHMALEETSEWSTPTA